jgi:hypothetical protein
MQKSKLILGKKSEFLYPILVREEGLKDAPPDNPI